MRRVPSGASYFPDPSGLASRGFCYVFCKVLRPLPSRSVGFLNSGESTSGAFKYSTCLNLRPYIAICLNMLQYASKCLNMPQYAFRCLSVHQYASICYDYRHDCNSVCHYNRCLGICVPCRFCLTPTENQKKYEKIHKMR